MSPPALAAAALATSGVAAAVSISSRLPAEFGHPLLGRLALRGSREHVLRDFVTWRGTAIAPPLPVLVTLAGLAAGAARGSERAGAALAALAGIAVVGHLGEPVTWHALRGRTPRLVTVLVALSLSLYAGIAALGLRALPRYGGRDERGG